MTAFATVADLATRLGVTLSAEEATRAEALLARASGLVQDVAKQEIALVEDDVLTLQGTNEDRLLLPERPVVKVTSVALDGVALDGWYLDGNALVRNGYSLDGLLVFAGSSFGTPGANLVITYTHGYAEPPATVASIVLEAVVRVWVNPGAVIGERHGSEQVQYGQSEQAGLLLTRSEQRAIRRLFGHGAGSVSQS